MTLRAQPSRAMKRPLSDPLMALPMPSTARRRMEPPRTPFEPRFVGYILSYDQVKGYGFIESEEVPEGDVYFQRAHLPAEAQARPRGMLRGQAVEFSVFFTPDRKPRADMIRLLGPPRLPSRGPPEARGSGGIPPDRLALPPPLNGASVEEMTRFLEDAGGSMDFGKFTREFKGVKKSQLEPHFRLTPEDEDAGGRWQIALLDPEEQASRAAAKAEKEDHKEPKGGQDDVPLGHFVGGISVYEPAKGYGFIKSEEVTEGDVYFKRSELPQEVQSYPRARIIGMTVEFDCHLTPQGKARAEHLKVVDEAPQAAAPAEDGEAANEDGLSEGATHKKEKAGVTAPPLSPEVIAEMTQFLEDQGGVMDYGKFSNAFAGVKKPQLEGHFTLVPESSDAGGRWQITLPGVDPLPPEERERSLGEPRAAKAGARSASQGAREARPAPLEPSATLWLIGCVKKWDQRKNFGFLIADGADDVFIHRNDLPPELQAWNGSLIGAEVAFELEISETGKLRAKQVRALLAPDARGAWTLRRAHA